MANDKENCCHSSDDGIGTQCVSVYTKEQKLEPRQALVDVEGGYKYILQIGEHESHLLKCLTTIARGRNLQEQYLQFQTKTSLLTPEELSAALITTSLRLSQHLESTVPCVGCRTAGETMLRQVSQVEGGEPPGTAGGDSVSGVVVPWPHLLDPVTVGKGAREIGLTTACMADSNQLYRLLYAKGTLYETVFNELTKIRRNRRCSLHSLESQRVTPTFDWISVWDQFSQDCRVNITQIPLDTFKVAFQSHLHKHRFCPECRLKMERAYSLLVQDHTCGEAVCEEVVSREFRPSVYNGLRICREESDHHVHIDSEDDELIADLMDRAFVDLTCSRQERHAKTLEVAQEEVVTCLATMLLEKVHRVGQRVRSEGQTWLLLMSQVVDIFKCNLETALERKQGFSRLDLFLWEHQREEESKLVRREHRKEKRSKKRRSKKTDEDSLSVGGGVVFASCTSTGPSSNTTTGTSAVHEDKSNSSPSALSSRSNGTASLPVQKHSDTHSETVISTTIKTGAVFSAEVPPLFSTASGDSQSTTSSSTASPSLTSTLFELTCPKCGAKIRSASGNSSRSHCSPRRDSGKMGLSGNKATGDGGGSYGGSNSKSHSRSGGGGKRGGTTAEDIHSGAQSRSNTSISEESSLCSQCREMAAESQHSSLFDGFDASDPEEDCISAELMQLQASLPQLKKEREQYREELRKKWSTTMATTTGVD